MDRTASCRGGRAEVRPGWRLATVLLVGAAGLAGCERRGSGPPRAEPPPRAVAPAAPAASVKSPGSIPVPEVRVVPSVPAPPVRPTARPPRPAVPLREAELPPDVDVESWRLLRELATAWSAGGRSPETTGRK